MASSTDSPLELCILRVRKAASITCLLWDLDEGREKGDLSGLLVLFVVLAGSASCLDPICRRG